VSDNVLVDSFDRDDDDDDDDELLVVQYVVLTGTGVVRASQ